MAKIYIETYGCTFNQAESRYMENILKKEHEIVDNARNADIVIINSCTVKQEAETKLYRALRRYKDKKIIIGGCVPQADPQLIETKLKDYSIIGPGAINKIGIAVEKVLNNERFVDINNYRPNRLQYLLNKNNVVSIIPINDGCLGNCYFCKTKQSRGDLYSYPFDIIVNAASIAISKGMKELWITSQDTGAYGLDINKNLIQLISEIINRNNEKDFFIRIGMMNPNHGYRMRKELKELLKKNQLFKFLHLSVQSGSDKVLMEMNRPHNVKHFVETVKAVREEDERISIATDIIVGYPTENDEDFELTLSLIERVKPTTINLSRFWPRPGTVAARMKPLRFEIVKKRMKRIHELIDEVLLKENEKWLNWSGIVIIDEKGRYGSLKARNSYYKQIIIPERDVKSKGLRIGDIVSVEVERVTKQELFVKTIEKHKKLY